MPDEVFMTFNFGETSGQRTFVSPQDLYSFLNQHLESYRWIVNLGTPMSQVLAQEYLNLLAQTRQMTVDEISQPNIKPRLENLLAQIFRNGLLPIIGSNEFDFIDKIRVDRGEAVAAAALSYITRKFSHLQLNAKETWDGLLLAFARQENLSKSSAAAARTSYDRLSVRVQNLAAKSETAEHQREQRFTDQFALSERKQDILRRWKSRQLDRQAKQFAMQNQSAIDALNVVKNTYEEMMKLKAPVEYWTDKAKSHRNEAVKYREMLIRYGWKIALGILLSLVAIAVSSFVFAQADKPATAYLLLVTIGVVITTMGFWAARIVVRLYMSEHHLAIDAEERATMAMTYLALIERGAAEEKDRALILAPLFRPSSDGIVKDDAAPDLSPAALLSKALSK